jgi:retinol dehydrogenase 12
MALVSRRHRRLHECIDYVLADLAIQQAVHQLAQTVMTRYDRLDVLVNNAGTIYFDKQRQLSQDGIERTVALNHMSYFILSLELLPLLAASGRTNAPARIINTASSTDKWQRIAFFSDFQSARFYHPFLAYGRTKIANVLFTFALARRLHGKPVTVNAVHPGIVNTHTPPGTPANGLDKFIQRFYPKFMITPAEGAKTTVYAATAPEASEVSGQYLYEQRVKATPAFINNVQHQERLWSMSEMLVV